MSEPEARGPEDDDAGRGNALRSGPSRAAGLRARGAQRLVQGGGRGTAHHGVGCQPSHRWPRAHAGRQGCSSAARAASCFRRRARRSPPPPATPSAILRARWRGSLRTAGACASRRCRSSPRTGCCRGSAGSSPTIPRSSCRSRRVRAWPTWRRASSTWRCATVRACGPASRPSGSWTWRRCRWRRLRWCVASKLGAPADLVRAPLIRVSPFGASWTDWATAAGLDAQRFERRKGMQVDGMGAALRAAAHGLGVALAFDPVIDSEIRSGALVRVGPGVKSRGADLAGPAGRASATCSSIRAPPALAAGRERATKSLAYAAGAFLEIGTASVGLARVGARRGAAPPARWRLRPGESCRRRARRLASWPAMSR